MVTASEIRKSMGVKTTHELFRESIDCCIKRAAQEGKREVASYLIDRMKYTNDECIDMTIELERDGFHAHRYTVGDFTYFYISW